VKGTLSILRAAKDCGVARVVLMSSKSAMVPNPSWPADEAIAEDDCWADVELLEKRQVCSQAAGYFHDVYIYKNVLSHCRER
jgi:nucleoside-diphosphate-sugar epimerase